MIDEEKVVPSPDNPLYAVGQVADMFGVDDATVRKWIRDESIKAHKIMGRWRIQKSELIRFANEEYGSE